MGNEAIIDFYRRYWGEIDLQLKERLMQNSYYMFIYNRGNKMMLAALHKRLYRIKDLYDKGKFLLQEKKVESDYFAVDKGIHLHKQSREKKFHVDIDVLKIFSMGFGSFV